jgi:hypothetical protein
VPLPFFSGGRAATALGFAVDGFEVVCFEGVFVTAVFADGADFSDFAGFVADVFGGGFAFGGEVGFRSGTVGLGGSRFGGSSFLGGVGVSLGSGGISGLASECVGEVPTAAGFTSALCGVGCAGSSGIRGASVCCPDTGATGSMESIFSPPLPPASSHVISSTGADFLPTAKDDASQTTARTAMCAIKIRENEPQKGFPDSGSIASGSSIPIEFYG